MVGVADEEIEVDGMQSTRPEAFGNNDRAGAMLRQSRSARLPSTPPRYATGDVYARFGADFRAPPGTIRTSPEMRNLPYRGVESAQASRPARLQIRPRGSRMSDHVKMLRTR